ncbi:hypothetical protein CJ030_MR7G008128 [Morella rubra]|uniref:PB1-like domain-containing protein n=1 Tax=Morella rubra TaxID=262757 RepID=A0A6A1V421_9ROSI|nr:hypothetical protein CJ030_MR7G008128 [Morella rubra]
MASEFFLFEVHFRGRFDRQLGCNYVGGDISVYDEPYEPDCLSFIEVETIVKTYGYKVGDLIYYKEPRKSLDEGLKLVTSDHDVLQMVKCHEGEQVVVIYLQSFADRSGDDDNNESEADIDEEAERRRIGVNDPFWNEVLSSDDELFDVDVNPHHGDNSGAGPSSVGAGPSSYGTDSGCDNEVVDDIIRDTERGKMPMTKEEEHTSDGGDDEDMDPSYILESPSVSDDEVGTVDVYPGQEFHQQDMANPVIKLGLTSQIFPASPCSHCRLLRHRPLGSCPLLRVYDYLVL